jgi:hypothetical protein
MTKLLDAGHEQLFNAECSGLGTAWRRAAELAAQRARVEPTEAQPPAGHNGARSLLGAAVATFLLGLHSVPLIFHARDASGPDRGIDHNSAPQARSD